MSPHNMSCFVEQMLVSNVPAPRASVVWTKMPDGAVLFSTETEVYYSLNALGAFIWALLPRSVDELCAAVEDEYSGATREQIQADVTELLKNLELSALIE